jgi:hypothetical protein
MSTEEFIEVVHTHHEPEHHETVTQH